MSVIGISLFPGVALASVQRCKRDHRLSDVIFFKIISDYDENKPVLI